MSDKKKPDDLSPDLAAKIDLSMREHSNLEDLIDLRFADTPPDLLPDLQPAEETPPAPTPPTQPSKRILPDTAVMPVVKAPPEPVAAVPPTPVPPPPPALVPPPEPKAEPLPATEEKSNLPPTGAYQRRPEWKVLEPEDRSDPVPHEQFEAHDLTPEWRLICAGIRGKLHAHKGDWRDDSYRWARVDSWTILSVADGAGSASLSRIGSHIACDTVVKHLQELLTGLTLGSGQKHPPDADLQRLRTLLARAAEKARLNVSNEAQRRKVGLKEFATTLLVAIHTPWQDRELVAILQVGDGAVGLLGLDGFRRLGISDHGEYSSETRFLTTPGIELEFENRVVFSVPSRIRALALMTDGVSDDFYPEDKKLIELFEANPIVGISSKNDTPVPGLMHAMKRESTGEDLRDWLKYEKRGSSDDRTLMLMLRS